MDKATLDKVANVLLLIGGLNWGLVGLLETDLVGELFGFGSGLSRLVYTLVGVAAVYVGYNLMQAMSAKK